MVDELAGEAKFLCPTDRTAKAIAKDHQKAQLYRYGVNRMIEVTHDVGVHHGIDIFFAFMSDKLADEEIETSVRLCSDWLNFAYGEKLEDVSGWNKYQLDDFSVMVYGEETAVTDVGDQSQFGKMQKTWRTPLFKRVEQSKLLPASHETLVSVVFSIMYKLSSLEIKCSDLTQTLGQCVPFVLL